MWCKRKEEIKKQRVREGWERQKERNEREKMGERRKVGPVRKHK
jgi:hypothetical protein